MEIKKILKFYFLIISITLFLILFILYFLVDYGYSLKNRESVEKYCHLYNVDVYVVFATIKTESSHNPSAVSDAGAIGLMQIMPSTAEWLCEKNGIIYSKEKLFEPDFNIRFGVAYYAYLSEIFEGDMVFAAYNAGEGVVREWIANGVTVEKIPYPETKRYIEKVKRNIAAYKARYYLY